MTKCRTKLVKHFITFLIVNANQNVMAMKVKSRKLTKTVNFTQILHHKKNVKKKMWLKVKARKMTKSNIKLHSNTPSHSKVRT